MWHQFALVLILETQRFCHWKLFSITWIYVYVCILHPYVHTSYPMIISWQCIDTNPGDSLIPYRGEVSNRRRPERERGKLGGGLRADVGLRAKRPTGNIPNFLVIKPLDFFGPKINNYSLIHIGVIPHPNAANLARICVGVEALRHPWSYKTQNTNRAQTHKPLSKAWNECILP